MRGPGPTRIGIFGGTFDPPHVGHLVTAVNVRHAMHLDRVLFVVANEPWQKVGTRDITPANHRLALVRAAVAGVEGLEASSIEIDRGGHSYTADTLAVVSAAEPGAELFLILGADAASGLPTWERVEEVATAADVVVVDRPGSPGGAVPVGFRGVRIEVPRLEVSSTDLRARVADGRPLDFLVPAPVIAEIRSRQLYSGAADPGPPR